MAGGDDAELQRIREDIDSLWNALELAGVLPPREDLDAGAGASDTAGEPETEEAGDSTPPASSPAKETAVNPAAAGRETRETE